MNTVSGVAVIETCDDPRITAAIPDTLLLDRADDIEARVIGQVTYPGLKRLLDQALKSAAGGPCPMLLR